MRIVSIALPVVIVALIVAPRSATAQETDVAALLTRLQELEQTVVLLERRIAVLESAAPAPAVGQSQAATDPGNWRELANWRQLRRGMKMDEVRELLGEPARVEAIAFIRWYFGILGYVQFDADSRRVEGWSEPQ